MANRSGVNRPVIPVVLFWLRRDLRLEDNRGLAEALREARARGISCLPLFIFDTGILGRLEDRDDARVCFIYETLKGLKNKLNAKGKDLVCLHGDVERAWEELLAGEVERLSELKIEAVFANHDYEPYARKRDEAVAGLLAARGIPFRTFKDQAIFEKSEVVKEDGKPYTVFTPYSKKWLAKLTDADLKAESCRGDCYFSTQGKGFAFPDLLELGFKPSSVLVPAPRVETSILKKYASIRNLPSQRGTSRLGVHLRFGTVSIRKLVATARELGASAWLNELIWREFFMQILWHFPRVVSEAFRPEYDRIEWLHDEGAFRRWCDGQTGVPIVDAGMRELNATGFMHNRVRMIAGSYLTKHLLIDWRWGEAYFARKLLDFDLASNNGNWQWVAGSGCDAAPYFRVFNPDLQTAKFDPDATYIRNWVPEFGTSGYPEPLVEHAWARARALKAYEIVKKQ